MKIRWQVILAVTLLGVMIFLATTSVFAKLTVEKPLYGFLQENSNIIDFHVEEERDITRINLTLNSLDNPIEVHKETLVALQGIMSNKEIIITYNNELPKENTQLWNKYWRVNVIISNVILNGNLTESIVLLDELLGEGNYYLLVEENNLFFSFNLEQNQYFNVFKLERGEIRW